MTDRLTKTSKRRVSAYHMVSKKLLIYLSNTMTDHHVGLLNRWQGSVEGNGRLSSKLGGSEVGGQRLRQSIADHQTVQDSDGVGQQSGVGESSKPRDAAVHAPLNVTTHACRPELIQRQQRQHLSTDPVTVTN